MASARAAIAGKGSQGGALLKGSSLPAKIMELVIKVTAVREAPEEWDSALILDFETQHDCEALALNKTNTRALIGFLGDDFDQWEGATVTLEKFKTRNPKTSQLTWGLLVANAKLARGKKKVEVDEDVPF